MGKKIVVIILGICIIALSGADVYLYMEIAHSGEVQAYSEDQAETVEKEENQSETEEQDSDGITLTMSGFKVGNQNTGIEPTTDTESLDGNESASDTDKAKASNADYILPDSDSKYYKQKDLKKLTRQEVKLARNEIYARHGRRFTKDMTVKKYFEGKDWYQATVDEVPDSQLNKYEIANRDMIVAYEEKKKWR